MKDLNFSTQWEDENILISIQKGVLISYFVKVFFKNWVFGKTRKTNYYIKLKFGKKVNLPVINTPLFQYQREINDNEVVTHISKINIIRAFVRSGYKIIMNKADIVGIPELYMAIIRKGIIEPIEYFNYKNGWTLIHASVFCFQNKIFIISAGSKAGKSTFVKTMLHDFEIEILSDNYGFIKGNKVRTIEEPFRSGKPSRHKLTFYNRSISGYSKIFEGSFDYLIYMIRGEKNAIGELNKEKLERALLEINDREKEGIYYLNDNDIIKTKEKQLQIKTDNNLFTLEVAEGKENIEIAIEKVSGLI